MILSNTQNLVWNTRWRSLADLRLRYQGGPNAKLTVAQLAGDPPDDNPTQQAARLPKQMQNDIKEAARRAILQIAPAGHKISHSQMSDKVPLNLLPHSQIDSHKLWINK